MCGSWHRVLTSHIGSEPLFAGAYNQWHFSTRRPTVATRGGYPGVAVLPRDARRPLLRGSEQSVELFPAGRIIHFAPFAGSSNQMLSANWI
jgi:hypothetical protein